MILAKIFNVSQKKTRIEKQDVKFEPIFNKQKTSTMIQPKKESLAYHLPKFSEAVRRIRIHPGDAKERLTSEIGEIIFLEEDLVPTEFKKDWNKLILFLNKYSNRLNSMDQSGAIIQLKTASRYIKLIEDVLWHLERED